jgi:hypothetical protein
VTKQSYQKHKESARERQAEQSRTGRDIGDIPPPDNQARRDAAELSFRVFCETYFSPTFCKPWSDDHIRVLGKVQRAVLFGGLFAVAMPRGSGKTSITIAACLWALLTGEREFVALIGADEGAASELLESIKTELETNDILAADFPEACKPIRALEGIPQRRLLYKGEAIRMEFTAKSLVLPNIPGSPSSEAVVVTAGITGRIRGMHYKRGDGRSTRPSLVVIDDPQTDESASSASQCQTRERVLSGAILGLAGPGQKISGIMPCTVIRPGDMADQILDSRKYPQWNGERTRMVYSWPADKERWAKYRELRSDAQRQGREPAEATEYLKSNYEAMHAGSQIAWADRKHDDELSALQHAYNLRFDMGEAAFMAEYQNDPPEEESQTLLLSRDSIAAKVSGYDRGTIPNDAAHLSAFIDVQGKLLYWAVCAWRPDFTGYVIDYGAWPSQRRSYFTLADAVPTIPDHCNGGLEAQIYAALERLAVALLGKEWQVDGGQTMKIGRCLIDANWGESTPTVYSFCRQSPYASILLPTHGRGVKASGSPIMLWPHQEGEQVGLNWRIRRTTKKHAPIRHGVYDTNFWKSFMHARLFVPHGDNGSLSLFKAEPAVHRMLADQLHAEYPVPVESQGRKVSEWQNRPNQPDNHFLDCLVGCCVGGSMLGAVLDSLKPAQKKAKKTLAELRKAAS